MTDALHISAADLGSNTVKILHAIRHPDGRIEPVEHVTNTIRLGSGMESTGAIETYRMDACVNFLQEQETFGRGLGSTAFIGVATEALRIARNGQELLDRIRSTTGWEIRVISGTEEAEITFAGLQDIVPPDSPTAIVDIGGGSTEVVAIEDGSVVWQRSLRIGSGRLADRYFHADPPGIDATASAYTAAIEAFSPLDALPVEIGTMLLSGGNGVFLAELVAQLLPDETLNSDAVEGVLRHLSLIPADDTVKRLDIALARAKVLPAGVAIALAAMTKTRPDVVLGVPSGIQLGLIARHISE